MVSPDAVDFTAVLKEWNASHCGFFHLRECDLQWNLYAQNLVSYQFAKIDGVPSILGVATDSGVAAGLSPKSCWLSLWGSIPKGRELEFVEELLQLGLREGKTRFAIGGDEFHFFPGIPAGDALVEAVKAKGFEGAEACDLIGRANDPSVAGYIREARSTAERDGWTFELNDDKDNVSRFLTREFPGRWTREFQTWRGRNDTQRAFWATLRKSGKVLGFARMAVRDRIAPIDRSWTPGALRLAMSDIASEAWSAHDACLGPIGVAASERGKGAGKVLLGFVLETLIGRNAGRICIDWTNAMKYYSPLGFRTVRSYWTTWKSI